VCARTTIICSSGITYNNIIHTYNRYYMCVLALLHISKRTHLVVQFLWILIPIYDLYEALSYQCTSSGAVLMDTDTDIRLI
jgi:hypothetical protein